MIIAESVDNSFEKYEEPHIHMQKFLSFHLIDFDFPMRILCPLDRAGIRTIGDLSRQTRADLRKISNIGALSLRRIEVFMERWGLQLAK